MLLAGPWEAAPQSDQFETVDDSIQVGYCLDMRNSDLTEALETLGALVTERDLALDVAVVGGGALLLQGLVLRPTPGELRGAAAWCRTHDPSPGFRDMLLVPVVATFGVEIDDAG